MSAVSKFLNREPLGTWQKWKGNLRRTDGNELWYKDKVIAMWKGNHVIVLVLWETLHPLTEKAIEETQQEILDCFLPKEGLYIEYEHANPNRYYCWF